MSPVEPEPTADELAAMAYVDGELDPAARAEFQLRMRGDPALAREVVRLQALDVLARDAAGPEPMDFEWQRIASSPADRLLSALAWTSLVAGGLGLLGWGIVVEVRSDLPIVPKVLITAVALGLALLLVLAVLHRRRTLPYDPYDKVQR